MNQSPGILERTLASLILERVGADVFVADPGAGRHRLFGGLVAAQCVIAAGKTVDPARHFHSIHGYFLWPGSAAVPIELEVTRLRDGGSFSARQVNARQEGEVIFSASTSFARAEEGMSRQSVEMPEVPEPAGLPDREQERSTRYKEVLGVDLKVYESAVEVKLCEPEVVEPGAAREARQDNWLRVIGEVGDDQLLQRAMLVYASDRTLLATARMPYDVGRHRLMSVSLDHTVWVHRPVDMSEWHLCQCESPVSHGGRAVLLAHIYRRDGVCVATVAQEGLVRVRR